MSFGDFFCYAILISGIEYFFTALIFLTVFKGGVVAEKLTKSCGFPVQAYRLIQTFQSFLSLAWLRALGLCNNSF